MNNITISGHVSSEPKSKVTKNGTKIVQFNVAVRRNDKETDFFPIMAIGARGDLCESWLKKGSKIICWGAMNNDKYEDRDGKKRDNWQLILGGIEFLSRLKKEDKAEESKDMPF